MLLVEAIDAGPAEPDQRTARVLGIAPALEQAVALEVAHDLAHDRLRAREMPGQPVSHTACGVVIMFVINDELAVSPDVASVLP